jgi:hypothetical protein
MAHTVGMVHAAHGCVAAGVRVAGGVMTERASLSLAQVADRIRTGCVYEVQPVGTFGLLVTRDDPRRRWRARVVQTPIDQHWAWAAPSLALLTGHPVACQHRCCRHDRKPLGWEGFAHAYRAELDRWPFLVQLEVVCQIAWWLRTYRSVTILYFEPGMPRGPALLACQQRGEFVLWAQRHIVREWLLSLPPVRVQGRMGAGGQSEEGR